MALDLLGFEHQVVYSSLCAPLFSIRDPDVRYPAYRAHNRAMAEFCSVDARLLGVAMCDLDDVDRALREVDAALDLGAREVLVAGRVRREAGRQDIPTTTGSGRASPSGECRSCCTSAAGRSPSTTSG